MIPPTPPGGWPDPPMPVNLAPRHRCLDAYQHGEATPWTCRICQRRWRVEERHWVPLDEEHQCSRYTFELEEALRALYNATAILDLADGTRRAVLAEARQQAERALPNLAHT